MGRKKPSDLVSLTGLSEADKAAFKQQAFQKRIEAKNTAKPTASAAATATPQAVTPATAAAAASEVPATQAKPPQSTARPPGQKAEEKATSAHHSQNGDAVAIRRELEVLQNRDATDKYQKLLSLWSEKTVPAPKIGIGITLALGHDLRPGPIWVFREVAPSVMSSMEATGGVELGLKDKRLRVLGSAGDFIHLCGFTLDGNDVKTLIFGHRLAEGENVPPQFSAVTMSASKTGQPNLADWVFPPNGRSVHAVEAGKVTVGGVKLDVCPGARFLLHLTTLSKGLTLRDAVSTLLAISYTDAKPVEYHSDWQVLERVYVKTFLWLAWKLAKSKLTRADVLAAYWDS